MRVISAPLIKQKQIYNANRNINNSINLISNTRNIPNHSINELLGKTQVISFNGRNINKANFITHTCTNKNGVSEEIRYHKESGTYTHFTMDKNGDCVKFESYSPEPKRESIFKRDKNGGTTNILITEEEKCTNILNSEGFPIRTEKIVFGEYSETYEYDWKKGIVTCVRKDKDGESIIKSYNLKTGKPIQIKDLGLGF